MARDYEASRQEKHRQQTPPTCQLAGETFTCVEDIALGALIDLAYEGITLVSSNAFVRAAVVDADVDRLDTLLHRKVDPVTREQLMDLVHDLVERYSGRPTGRPSDSPDGPLTTGPNSKDELSSPESETPAA